MCYIYLHRCMYIYMGDKIRDERTTAIASKPSHAKRPGVRQERERDATPPPRSTRPTSRPPRRAADVTQAVIVQSFRGGVSPQHACSRFREHLRDFARFQELFKIRHLPGLGRLTLVICAIMARDSAPPPLPKPRRGLIFQGFSAAVSFSHSFTLHLCPFQLSPYSLLKNQNQDFKRFSLSNCCIYHTMAYSIIIWLKCR